eukprot:CAMPEP_0185770476 /NCGR_PEP_ID=MMETSP1174-20130828/59284_1 /TAXON_ID=35687 /ORGANISM="Dictyocha speculum, Strain CCMP1381" /LENGTH=115 /DNA_ID=CAMNT_0028455911 /DNA_START=55 /DNA_END=402 /DNA_ORIENTATION=+
MRVIFSLAFLATAAAFVQQPARTAVNTWVKTRTPVMSMSAADVFATAPMLSPENLLQNVPMQTALEVSTPAFLAVLLGTFLPVLFLITLYLSSEARSKGIAEGYDGTYYKETDNF